jgi:hypothetical protein
MHLLEIGLISGKFLYLCALRLLISFRLYEPDIKSEALSLLSPEDDNP